MFVYICSYLLKVMPVSVLCTFVCYCERIVHICFLWVFCAHLFTFALRWAYCTHWFIVCALCMFMLVNSESVLCKCLLLLASLLWVHIMCRTFVCCGCIVCMSYERIWRICLHVFNLKVKSVFVYLLFVGVLCTFVCICSRWRVYLHICLLWAYMYCAHLFALLIRAHHVTVHMWVVSVSCTCVVRVLCTCLHLLWVHIIVWSGYD